MTWTRELLEQLKRDIAGKAGGAVITFEGQRILVGYAKYLAEYLETQLVAAPAVKKVTLNQIVGAYEDALKED